MSRILGEHVPIAVADSYTRDLHALVSRVLDTFPLAAATARPPTLVFTEATTADAVGGTLVSLPAAVATATEVRVLVRVVPTGLPQAPQRAPAYWQRSVQHIIADALCALCALDPSAAPVVPAAGMTAAQTIAMRAVPAADRAGVLQHVQRVQDWRVRTDPALFALLDEVVQARPGVADAFADVAIARAAAPAGLVRAWLPAGRPVDVTQLTAFVRIERVGDARLAFWSDGAQTRVAGVLADIKSLAWLHVRELAAAGFV